MAGSRKLSNDFMNALKGGGRLAPLIDRVKSDDTLMLALRGNYINIYYRGGNLLKVEEIDASAETFKPIFDWKYFKGGGQLLRDTLQRPITSSDHVLAWLKAFPQLKQIMDEFFAKTSKAEREFQQLVAWENNRSPVANETEYFITDIEFVEGGGRIDMLGGRWLRNDRNKGLLSPVIIEMKYGNGALESKSKKDPLKTTIKKTGSGLLDHLIDIEAIFSDKKKTDALRDTIQDQFKQLTDLGLLRYTGSDSAKKQEKITFSQDMPQVIILLANYNLRSDVLKTLLETIKRKNFKFDLRFFVSTFAGYGMHADAMLKLEQFQQLLADLRPPKAARSGSRPSSI